jgi:hypothetical protein
VIGIVYGVRNRDNGVIEKVGSTVRTLRQRTIGYRRQRWFTDAAYELVPLRSVEHTELGFFHILLRAVESSEITKNHTWRDEGGRNHFNPLIQLLNHPQIESEIASIGGKITAAIPGHMSKAGKIGGQIGGVIGGHKNGQLSVDNGRLASLRTKEHQSEAGKRSIEIHGCRLTLEDCKKGGKTQGRIARDSSQLRRVSTKESCSKGGSAACLVNHAVKDKNGKSIQAIKAGKAGGGSLAATHARWHTKYGVINSLCSLCSGVK